MSCVVIRLKTESPGDNTLFF